MAAARAAAAPPALMESDTEMAAPTAQANGPAPAATRPFDAASAAKVLDLKGVLSPPKFPASDRAESEFGSSKYGFTSAMALIGLDVALEDAETNRTEPLLAATGQPHCSERKTERAKDRKRERERERRVLEVARSMVHLQLLV
jgi:hypothetical protein